MLNAGTTMMASGATFNKYDMRCLHYHQFALRMHALCTSACKACHYAQACCCTQQAWQVELYAPPCSIEDLGQLLAIKPSADCLFLWLEVKSSCCRVMAFLPLKPATFVTGSRLILYRLCPIRSILSALLETSECCLVSDRCLL